MFDRRRTLDELEAVTGVSWSSCQRILTEELHMKRVAAKFVPRLLSEDQRSRPHSIECAAVSHEKRDDNGSAPPPTPRTRHPAIFSYFQEWRGTLKESVFRTWRRWGEKQRRHWRLSLCKSSRTVWTMETAMGYVYCFSRRVFWRWLNCGNVQRNIRFFKKNSHYFWVPPRIRRRMI